MRFRYPVSDIVPVVSSIALQSNEEIRNLEDSYFCDSSQFYFNISYCLYIAYMQEENIIAQYALLKMERKNTQRGEVKQSLSLLQHFD
jgi:hypothetical protein